MRGGTAPAFTADGRAILHPQVGDAENGRQLVLTPLDGSPTRVLTDTDMIQSIAVHPDGRQIAWQEFTSSVEFWVIENLLSESKAAE